jgi:hypothetical protein
VAINVTAEETDHLDAHFAGDADEHTNMSSKLMLLRVNVLVGRFARHLLLGIAGTWFACNPQRVVPDDGPAAAVPNLPQDRLTEWLRANYPSVDRSLSSLPDGEYVAKLVHVNGVVRTIKFWKHGDQLRLDGIDEAPKQSHWLVLAHGATGVGIQDPQGTPQVTAHKRESELHGLKSSVDNTLLVLSAAWSFLDVSIDEFIHEDGFDVDGLELIERDGSPLLKVSWLNRSVAYGDQYGWFLFDRDHGWRLHEFTRGFVQGRTSTSKLLARKMTYSGTSQITATIEEGIISADGASFERRSTITTLKAAPDPPPPSVFDVTQFGLPDLFAEHRPEPRSPWRWWLAGAAAIAVAGWWLARRERKKAGA